MNNDCIKRNTMLVIGLLLIFFSGWFLGCGVGRLLKCACEGIIIGIGISAFAVAAVLLKIYFIDKNYENMKNLYKR